MLGCQDFCGYYDWTFGYVRKQFGQAAVHRLWRDAIGGESQQHYLDAAKRDGLRGLLKVWTATGEDERCDWTFTLDESRNTLRWDMRQCPSKGFLVQNGLQNDEDYCDHCMGWIAPVLANAGAQIVAHEHNHCGQCWAEIAMCDRPSLPLDLAGDIRRDPRWGAGYVDRFERSVKLPLLGSRAADPVEAVRERLSRFQRLLVVGRGPSAAQLDQVRRDGDAIAIVDPTYRSKDVFNGEPDVVFFGDGPVGLDLSAKRYRDTPADRRPVLLHAYLPSMPFVDFEAAALPRPLPILPALLRGDVYTHRTGEPYPTSGTFLALLAAALEMPVRLIGIDLYQHASRRRYAADKDAAAFEWPARHSLDCELRHLSSARKRLGAKFEGPDELLSML